MKKIIAYLGLTCVLVISLSGCCTLSSLIEYTTIKPKDITIHLPDAIVGKPYSTQIPIIYDRKDIKGDIMFYDFELNPDNLGLKCIKCMPFLPDSGVDYRLYIDDINAGRGKYGNDGFSGSKVIIEGTPTATGTITIETNIVTSYTMMLVSTKYIKHTTFYKINIIDAKEPEEIECRCDADVKEPKKIEQDKENTEGEK